MILACRCHGAETAPDNEKQLETFKKVMADFKTKQSQAASENGEFSSLATTSNI
jgi:hypothetical protein